MKRLINEKFIALCDKLTMTLLCVLMMDCALLGSGRAIEVGPLGLRMILLGLLLVAAIPLVIQQFSRLMKNPIIWILLAFAAWLVLEAVLGLCNGNNRQLLVGDLKGFAYFVAVVPALCVLNTKDRVHLLMKAVMYAAALLGVVALGLLALYVWLPDVFNQIVGMDANHHLTMFAAVTKKIPRLFFKSTPYLLCGSAFSIYFAVKEKGCHTWQYPAIVGISLFALLLSYTRSIYLAVGVAAAFAIATLWLALDRDGKRRLLKMSVASAAVCLAVTLLCSVVMQANYLGYGLDRLGVTLVTLGKPASETPEPTDATETEPSETNPEGTKPNAVNPYQQATIESDKLRAQTMKELNKNIWKSPILGHGLGKGLAVRGIYANEYIYQDIWMKMGIIGLLLFFAPSVLLVLELFRRIREKEDSISAEAVWLAVLLGFMAFSYFNPYMNASLGILFYCCTIGVLHVDHKPKVKNI